MVRVSDIFGALTSFACPEMFSADLGAKKCQSTIASGESTGSVSSNGKPSTSLYILT
jgi:hypothetical protein